MKKEQIAKKNREKEELRKNEDHIANRVMVVFAAAILMLLGLSYLWRAYDVAATLLAAIRINRILIGVSALGLAASLGWWILSVHKGTYKKDSICNGAMFSCFFAVLLPSLMLIQYSASIAQRVLYVVIPGIAILHLVYSSYQREFFSFCVTHSLICYLMWIMARTYNPSLELSALAAVLTICAAAFCLFLLASRKGGMLSLGGLHIRLTDNRDLRVSCVGAVYGGTALLALAAYFLGVPYAYYCLYALIGLVIGMAVYFTVKLI